MDNSLQKALLYLLPSNLYQSPDNPLQPDRLPKTYGVELDYPVYQDPPETAAKYLLTIVFFASLVAPILAWTAHLVPIPYLHGGLYTIALLIAGGLIVLGIFGRWWPLASFAVAIAALPVLALLARDAPFVLAALLLVVVGHIIFADSLVTAFLYFKTAAPLPRQQSLRVRSLWRRRFFNVQSPLRGSELYFLGFLVILPVAWLVLNGLGNTPQRLGFRQVVALFAILASIGVSWCLVSELLLAPLFGRTPYSPLKCGRALFRALVIWSTYNRRNARGAGVHQSPAGSCATRCHLLIGLIAAWGCVWAGLQWQNSTHPLAQIVEQLKVRELLAGTIYPKPRPQSTRSVDPQLFTTDPAAGDPLHYTPDPLNPGPIPDLQAPLTAGNSKSETDIGTPNLEPFEIEFIKRLSPEQKENYLRERFAAHVAEHEQVEAERLQAADSQSPKNLLVAFFQQLAKVLFNVLIPSLCVLAAAGSLLLATAGRALAGIEDCLGASPPERVFHTDRWENLVARVRGSEDEWEKQSVLMGVNARDDTPVLVPSSVFGEHAHVLGDSGSGKTSLGLVPLITQLMRFGDCSVVVVDLKADDQYFMETLRREAASLDERLKKATEPSSYPFRWFSTVLGQGSFGFNPLTQPVMSQLDPDQRTDIMTAALGLQYGNDYGRKYFGDANYDLLNYAMRENPRIQSLAELEQVLAGAEQFPLPKKTKDAATHVRSSVRRLARCKALNVCPNQHTPQAVLDNAINLDDLFAQPQALYVALPTSAGISSTAEVARIFLYALLASARAHKGRRKPVYLVIDEFQRIVSKNVELFLQQARSMDIGCILSNQSLEDLDSVDADLIPAVRTNTRFRQVFGAGCQKDIEDLIASSGEAVYANRNWSFSFGLFQHVLRNVAVQETRGTRLSINDILLATDAPGRNISCVRRGKGYAQFGGMPFLMDSVYHIDPVEYDNRSRTPWPDPDERMIVATMPDADSPSSPADRRLLGEPEIKQPQNVPTASNEQELDSDADTSASVATAEESGEGILDDLTTFSYFQQQAEREAMRRRLQAEKGKRPSRRDQKP